MQKTRTGNIIKFEVDQMKVDRLLELKKQLGDRFPKFGVLVLSYNASDHIEKPFLVFQLRLNLLSMKFYL